MHQTMETELKQLLETVPLHKDVHWLNRRWYMYKHNVRSVTSELSQSSSRSVSAFNDLSALLNKSELYKSESFHKYILYIYIYTNICIYICIYILYIYIHIYIHILCIYIYIYIYVFVRNKCMNGDIDDILMVKSGVIVEML